MIKVGHERELVLEGKIIGAIHRLAKNDYEILHYESDVRRDCFESFEAARLALINLHYEFSA